jgi:2-polyprenyl-3-methyl-5-hydroxy-6-metoxy-1,4-benzoquinol methylase
MIPRILVNVCPVCSHRRSWPFQRFIHHGVKLHYRVCRRCGFVFMSPRFSDDDLSRFYERDYRVSYLGTEGQTSENIETQDRRSEHLATFVARHVPRAQHILDIGCSTGQLLTTLRASLGAQTATGVEPSNAHRSTAAARQIDAYASLEELERTSTMLFDVVSMSHVLEHIADPAAMLERIRTRLLSARGVLLLEVPNIYGSQSYEVAHLLCYSPETLQLQLERAGFRIIDQRVHSIPRHVRGRSYITVLARRAAAKAAIEELSTAPWRVHVRRAIGLPRWTVAHLLGERLAARLRGIRK